VHQAGTRSELPARGVAPATQCQDKCDFLETGRTGGLEGGGARRKILFAAKTGAHIPKKDVGGSTTGQGLVRRQERVGSRSSLPKFRQAVRFAFRAELREAEAFRIGLNRVTGCSRDPEMLRSS